MIYKHREKGISRIGLLAAFLAIAAVVGAILLIPKQQPAKPTRSSSAATSKPQGPVSLYAVWQPVVDGPFEKAEEGKPIGGRIILRVVVRSDRDEVVEAQVKDVTIFEQKNAVHPTKPEKLSVSFGKASSNPDWGDPEKNVVVLQSEPFETARFHNMPHTIRAKVRYMVSDTEVVSSSAQTEMVFGNLILKDTTTPRNVVPWRSGKTTGITFSCRLDHVQSGTCTVKYEVFRSQDNIKPVAVKVFENVPCPGEHSWLWTHTLASGKLIPDELFTYRITAETAPKSLDRDCNRSNYLQVLRAYDAQRNPEMFLGERYKQDWGVLNPVIPRNRGVINSYILKDSLDKQASKGEQWYYGEDLERGGVWDMRELTCETHGSKDGCRASKAGVRHDLLVSLSGKLTSQSLYCLITHAVDDHAGLYRDHQPKPALELN